MKKPIVSIVGGETLLGREVRDVISDRSLPVSAQLIGSEDTSGILTEQGGEAVVMTALDSDILSRSIAVFLAGSPESTQRAMKLMEDAGAKPLVVDLTGALEDHPMSLVRAPLLEPKGFRPPPSAISVVAHPAAIALATVFRRLQHRHEIVRSVVHVFEPASERGQAGLNELQQQTASLLSFRNLPKDVFDAQLSFNMLPRYGADAPKRLEDVEQRIERHIAALMGSVWPMPALRLIQAPVFHGYSLSIWIEFEENPGPEALAEALASAQVEIRSADMEAPNNVGSVGQSGVTLGLIERDRNNRKGMWMWAVADNFRVTVDTALDIAEPLLGTPA
jgi:aspartate-semialdehyde dehydrogenase